MDVRRSRSEKVELPGFSLCDRFSAAQRWAALRTSKVEMRFIVLGIAAWCLAGCGSPTASDATPRDRQSQSGLFANGDVRLSYQLDLPARTGPAPAVVFGHGSGRANKTSCRFLADPLLERGFATLCFDKRGVGESSGVYANVGTQNSETMFPLLASDMAAGVRFLRGNPDIDPARIGLAGNSQAGWIIPIAAAQADPAFMILVVGPTVSVGEEIFYSNIVEFSSAPIAEALERLRTYSGPRGFDPVPTLQALAVPGLWLLGGEDRSIPTPHTVAILDRLKAAGRPFEYAVVPGAGHNLPRSELWPRIDGWLRERGFSIIAR
jgi:pimeloyl-ACP methyl ester carboxylesterase